MAEAPIPWLRLTAWATLVQQCVGIFYATAGRYYYLTWLLTLLVVMVWFHGEGIEILRGGFRRSRSASPSIPRVLRSREGSIACLRMLDR